MRRVNDDDITKLCTLLYYISTVMLENIFLIKSSLHLLYSSYGLLGVSNSRGVLFVRLCAC